MTYLGEVSSEDVEETLSEGGSMEQVGGGEGLVHCSLDTSWNTVIPGYINRIAYSRQEPN